MSSDQTVQDAQPQADAPGKDTEVRALLEEAKRAQGKGRTELARHLFERVVAVDGDNEDAWLLLAAMHKDAGVAQAMYERVLRSHPESQRAQAGLERLAAGQVPRPQQQANKLPEPTTMAESPAAALAPKGESTQTPGSVADADGPALYVPPWDCETAIPVGKPAAAEPIIAEPARPEPLPDVVPVGGVAVEPQREHAATVSAVPAEIPAKVQAQASIPEPITVHEERPVGGAAGAREEEGSQGLALAGATESIEEDALAAESHEVTGERATRRPSPVTGPRMWPRRVVRDIVMVAMLGIVVLGAFGLVSLLTDRTRAEDVRVALGVVTLTPTCTETPEPTLTPTATATAVFSPTPMSTATSGPTPTFTPSPTPTQSWITAKYLPLPLGEKWIEVDLTKQTLKAYDGTVLVFQTRISSGRKNTPTLEGKFRIQRKLESQLMSGPGYYLPAVPYVMYFVGSYALHGAYWHNNWGTPMSHGCVNLRREDAKWLYDWTEPQVPAGVKALAATADKPGTWVLVHK